VQRELDLFDSSDTKESRTNNLLKWICRSYESTEHWKHKAKEMFFSLNGESDVSRNRFAAVLRGYLTENPPSDEVVELWDKDFKQIESVNVRGPKITASNSAYVDWCYIADYLLLGCAALSEDFEQENQKRLDEYRMLLDSFEIRLSVYDAFELIKNHSELKDDEVLIKLKVKHKDAALAHVKEARRCWRDNVDYKCPKPPRQSPPLARYLPLYFDCSKT
jgi:hypothetical protein